MRVAGVPPCSCSTFPIWRMHPIVRMHVIFQHGCFGVATLVGASQSVCDTTCRSCAVRSLGVLRTHAEFVERCIRILDHFVAQNSSCCGLWRIRCCTLSALDIHPPRRQYRADVGSCSCNLSVMLAYQRTETERLKAMLGGILCNGEEKVPGLSLIIGECMGAAFLSCMMLSTGERGSSACASITVRSVAIHR
jgi:hypothetical protein